MTDEDLATSCNLQLEQYILDRIFHKNNSGWIIYQQIFALTDQISLQDGLNTRINFLLQGDGFITIFERLLQAYPFSESIRHLAG